MTNIYNPGSGYEVGDRIQILGSHLGGIDGINNVVITVRQVSTGGGIEIATVTGQAPLFSSGQVYTNVSGTNIIGTGSGSLFDFVVDSGEITTFDGTSMRFEAPVDNYTSTDAYDKYLMFPRRNILV